MRRQWLGIMALWILALVVAGCGGDSSGDPGNGPHAQAPEMHAAADANVDAPARPTAAADQATHAKSGPLPLVIFLGDSLTAGYGLPADEAYPALLEAMLAAAGRPARVLNAGVSGDTTAGGLARLDWLLAQRPAIVVIALGANDGLRGMSLLDMEANLRRIIQRVRAAGVRVLLLGMHIPTNYGPDYFGRFVAVYPRLAEELDVPLVPALLEGVGGLPALNQPDGVHPNATGHRQMAENVFPALRELVEQIDSTAGSHEG